MFKVYKNYYSLIKLNHVEVSLLFILFAAFYDDRDIEMDQKLCTVFYFLNLRDTISMC